jgi:hypothetical protein
VYSKACLVARSQEEILSSTYMWIKEGLTCSAAVHSEKSESIKTGFGMKVKAK